MTLVVIQVAQRPANPLKDDRLDLSASGKCRSDPARLRAQGRQRGRGRHSLDIGRDLKRTITNPTIDENVWPYIFLYELFLPLAALYFHLRNVYACRPTQCGVMS